MKHHLFVGTWTPPGAIFSFEFDDESFDLKLIARTAIPEAEPISWMTLNHEKTTLYGAAMKKWNSFTVQSPTSIKHHSSHSMGGDARANDASTKTRAIFVLAAQKPPFNVYGNPFYDYAGYGNVFSVDKSGGLQESVQNYEYSPETAIHGMVFDPSESYLYSADMWANKIWCHQKDPETGLLTLVGSEDAPKHHDAPRWVEMHPSGDFLYALMEAGNTLGVYKISKDTHMPEYTGKSYPLVPKILFERNPKMYRADVVAISHSGKYLFATARSNSSAVTGYISAFALNADGSIQRQMCLSPTPTSGGHSNAIVPCDWSDEWLALTDDEQGWLEIYRWDGEWLARVAHCDVKEPGFGMNAVWYD
ncbi:3-carboxy-cis,cis-mucoante lactonizing enzyme [Microthyrium microscopicum]|uniref:3-carboxy-cis,cis-mucoante lactonizing enzyme n=1 Tax=Microthyrium microscopicum TaxID=703497 RepID=A0A6A6UQR1_9PEZI|nr:3-carboxy-cis,cis-mucoante lactonizing enzyme [Microthyrium microscopicum]